MRKCDSCGRQYKAASPRSRYCGNTCRSRAHRAAGSSRPEGNVRALRSAPPPPTSTTPPAERHGLAGSIETQLAKAGRLDTWQGQGALELAERIESGRDTGSAIASLHRELRAAMTEALRGVGTPESAVTRHRDQLAARRRQRAGGE
jgi:hypothetical protein